MYSNELRVPVQNFVEDLVRKGGRVCCAPVFDNHDIGDHGERDDNEENHDVFFAEFYLAPRLL